MIRRVLMTASMERPLFGTSSLMTFFILIRVLLVQRFPYLPRLTALQMK